MKKHIHWKPIVISQAIIVALIVIIWMIFISEESSQVNFVFGIGSIMTFILAIAGNIISASILSKCEEKENLKEIVVEALREEDPISLATNDKQNLLGRKFYDELYKDADEICICGIALQPVINYICKPDHEPESWVNKLKTNKNVCVKLLMASPSSRFVNALQQNGDPAKDKIQSSLNLLRDFQEANGEINLANGTSLVVKTTKEVISYNITYVKRGNELNKSSLRLGFTFNSGLSGPICNIKSNIDTHSNCIEYFKKLFDGGEEKFTWDENGIEWEKKRITKV